MTIFIDRDGVINKDPGGWTPYSYVTRWSEFHFIPGSLEALKLLHERGVKVIVISNQAGVNKGYFSKKALDEINDKMLEEVERSGGAIEDVYYCIHREEDNCPCRKPRTGLLETAARRYKVDLEDAYFIGDSLVDVQAGESMGMKTVFVKSGKTPFEDLKEWEVKPGHIFNDLLEATRWLLEEERR